MTALFTAHARAADVVELKISTDEDFLAFLPEELSCRTGSRVRIIFHHAGERIKQDHNWVLLKPGTEEAFITAAFKAGDAHGWMPPHDKRVIAATPLCGPGQSAMAEFIAPAPGDYPFLCSFAGHGEEMRGMLHVTA
jgi:azurin